MNDGNQYESGLLSRKATGEYLTGILNNVNMRMKKAVSIMKQLV